MIFKEARVMKRNLTRVLCSALAMSITLSLAACGSQKNEQPAPASPTTAPAAKTEAAATPTGDQKVKLRIYAQYADEDTKAPYDYALEALKKEMPNVELELDIQAQDDGQKIRTYAATGNLPDIFNVGTDLINTFKESNNILVLDEYVEKLKFKDKMNPNCMNTLTAPDGHFYAFPYAGNEFILIYYNKELFEKNSVKVPTTYDEFLTAVKTFNSKGIAPLSIFAKEKWICVGLFDAFATRLDPEGIKKLDAGKAKASDEAYRVAAEKLVELVKAGLLPKGATNLNYDQAASLFYQGKAAMFINGQWEIEASTKNLGDKVGYMYYPVYNAASADTTRYVVSGGGNIGGYAVSPKTKDKELAAKVASFMSLKYAECNVTTRAKPFVATKVDLPAKKEYPPMLQELTKDLPKLTYKSAFAWGLSNPKFKAGLEDNVQRLLTGTYTAENFVRDMDKVIEEAGKK